ncbi:hypothetical protein [Rhodococcus qingshengii]|uniref:hypothetical protein n=1 Tax=Rhodococcus qingshengii TaxID=334542 RepID=UPI0022B37BE0|nr:hypothetical protein [Rhodococcus qingshengii]MCZ4613324.1 hypothetical protein [Rhodococcus qingshengii]
MTAPDPGLTDFIAAHQWIHFAPRRNSKCACGWQGDDPDYPGVGHAAHLALVVEQHTNGRIAHWQSVAEVSRSRELNAIARAEKAEAKVTELEADSANWKSRYDDAKQVIAAGTANWTATILDRDDWKARAEKAEAELAKYHAEERRELEWARNRARDDVRCPSCNLRYGERDQYGCIEPARAHEYDADDLRAALEGEQQ